ncbi:unnamed protein product [Ophioblennius macclurei]
MEDFGRLVFALFSVLAGLSSAAAETALTCDLVQHKHTLRCDSGLILVHSVTVSQQESEVCVDGVRPTEAKPTSCPSARLLNNIQSKCNGQYNCHVTIDACHETCLKRCVWMETSYSCEPGKIYWNCQNEDAHLYCPRDQVIKVLMANYGRVSKKVCKYNYSDPPETDCKESAVEEVAYRCDGEGWCSVPVSNRLFYNRCPGTKKYLRYSYLCVDP